jgi:hypothetical protein
MTTFTVDPATLEALQTTITALCDELSGMHCVMPSFSGRLGGNDLEDEISHFLDSWKSGLDLIEGDIQMVAERLGQAVRSYGQTEAFISAASCH